jgi:predicted lysophospholipase L1 biosynthesis ABC-type transport system permease subunit
VARLLLYIRYAWRSLLRGGQRTLFAVLCVAVGVASIIALQNTGLSIETTLAGDARSNARADVVVTNRQGFFSQEDLAKLDTLKQNKTFLDYTTSIVSGVNVNKPDGSKSNDFGSFYLTYVVDPAKFPFYGKVEFSSPSSAKTFAEVLKAPNQVILNSKMAKSVGAKVGDKIKATSGATTQELEVVGILSDNVPSPDSGQAEFTGYDYVSLATAKNLFKPEQLLTGTVYIKTDSTISGDNKARDAINALSPTYSAKTSSELNEQIQQGIDGFRTLLNYVGLISLLIGSVGVVNTMLVVVGRRSGEIATIKALGMESNQTVTVFVIEAAILGVIGSIAGIILGEGLALLVTQAAEGFVNRNLNYQFYWSPVLIGLIVGIVTAVVFGLLPAYSASKIPPAQVLRDKSNALPRISILATLGIIVVMTVVMGLLAGAVLGGQLLLGVIVAFVTLVACSILVLIFAGILWLVGKLPLPFGLNYKMARRNLSRGRAKSATTLLVMMVGIFAMSLVIILSGSLKQTIQETLEKSFGYNMQVDPTSDSQADAIKQAFDKKQIPGSDISGAKFIGFNTSRTQLVSVVDSSGNTLTQEQLIARKLQNDKNKPANSGGGGGNFFQSPFASVSGFDPAVVPTFVKIAAGKIYAADNEVMLDKQTSDDYGLNVGSKLTLKDAVSGQSVTLSVVGVFEDKNFIVSLGSVVTTQQAVRALPSHTSAIDLNLDKGKLTEAKTYLEQNFAGTQATDLSFITNVINKLIDNITAFPVLLAFLCLIAGAVLIANNVALAVLERRTEMGVMKSVGADQGRVLAIINWETAIVGFLGGLFGFIIAASLASFVVQAFGTADNPGVLSLSPLIFLAMVGLAVVLAIVSTIASAWGAVQEKPLVVLRYE